MSKNKVIENRPVAEVIIDEKSKKVEKPLTREEAQDIVDAYKAQCKPFPVRMKKYESKKDELKAWVESHKSSKEKK